jgi:hypothetical protein
MLVTFESVEGTMKKWLLMGLSLAMLAVMIVASPAGADTLWYNGDFNGVSALTNGSYSTGKDLAMARVYDDFVVPTGTVWEVDTVWTNNLLQGTYSMAEWSIRKGVSEGNEGTVVASGISSNVTQTATGRSGFGVNEYTIQVTGIHVSLTPGTYWLSVAPIGDQKNFTFISTTSGANAIGCPPGNNGNAFDNDPEFGYLVSTTNVDASLVNFSMGVGSTALIGDPVPLPGAVWLLGSGLGLLAWGRKRRLS